MRPSTIELPGLTSRAIRGGLGNQLAKHLEPLGRQLDEEVAEAG